MLEAEKAGPNCPACGTPQRLDARFCKKCRKPISSGSSETKASALSETLTLENLDQIEGRAITSHAQRTGRSLELIRNYQLMKPPIHAKDFFFVKRGSSLRVEIIHPKKNRQTGKFDRSIITESELHEFLMTRTASGKLAYGGHVFEDTHVIFIFDDVRKRIWQVNASVEEIKQRKFDKLDEIDRRLRNKKKNWNYGGFRVGGHSMPNNLRDESWHENHDTLEVGGLEDERNRPIVRVVVADGAGGGGQQAETPRAEWDSTVFKELSQAADWICQRGDSIFEVVEQAHQTLNDKEAYGTIVAADVTQKEIALTWRGDAACVAWSDRGFNKKRLDGEVLANKVPFQLLTKPHNIAESVRDMSSMDTARMDTSAQSSIITNAFGDGNKEAGAKVIQRDSLQAGYLIFGTDGFQPNTLIADSNLTPDQAKYNQKVQEIMHRLSDEKIDVTQASEYITQAARSILKDSDDITVVVVDLEHERKGRRWCNFRSGMRNLIRGRKT